MASITSYASTPVVWNSNSGTKSSASFTPAVGDLIVVVTGHSGYTGSVAPTDDNSDGFGTYSLAKSSMCRSSADRVQIWVRDALVGAAAATVVSIAPGTTTGGGLRPLKVTGMSRAGASAIRQVGGQDDTAAATPAPSFPGAALTTNPLVGLVMNASNAAALSAPSGWSESFDQGYNTPTSGLECVTRDSGETGTTITWGSSSATAFGSVIVELDASSAWVPQAILI